MKYATLTSLALAGASATGAQAAVALGAAGATSRPSGADLFAIADTDIGNATFHGDGVGFDRTGEDQIVQAQPDRADVIGRSTPHRVFAAELDQLLAMPAGGSELRAGRPFTHAGATGDMVPSLGLQFAPLDTAASAPASWETMVLVFGAAGAAIRCRPQASPGAA